MSGPHSSEDLLALLELGEAPAGHVMQEPSAGVGTEQPQGQMLQEPSAGVGTEQIQWGSPVHPSDFNAELKAETGIPSPMYDATEDDETTDGDDDDDDAAARRHARVMDRRSRSRSRNLSRVILIPSTPVSPAGHVLQEPSAGVWTEQPKGAWKQGQVLQEQGQVLQEPSAGVGTEQTKSAWDGSASSSAAASWSISGLAYLSTLDAEAMVE